MNEKKLTPAQKIAGETFQFLDEAVKADTPAEGSSVGMQLNLIADTGMLKSLTQAIETAKFCGVLDASQKRSLIDLMRQVVRQVPREVVTSLVRAANHAGKRYEERQIEELFDAAQAAPSMN